MERQRRSEQCGQDRRGRRVQDKLLNPYPRRSGGDRYSGALTVGGLCHVSICTPPRAPPHAPHCFTLHQPGCAPHFLAWLVPGRNGRGKQNKDQGLTSQCIREKMLFINKPKGNLSFQSSSYCASNKLVTFSEKPQPVVR